MHVAGMLQSLPVQLAIVVALVVDAMVAVTASEYGRSAVSSIHGRGGGCGRTSNGGSRGSHLLVDVCDVGLVHGATHSSFASTRAFHITCRNLEASFGMLSVVDH